MKVVGLNGREYNLDLKKYMNNDRSKVSKYHSKARDLLHQVFHGYSILEEVKLPGSVNPAKKSVLYLDFLVTNVKMGIEVHGRQHYEFVPFFHKSKAGFAKAKKRDLDKKEWCRINDITLVELKWDEDLEYWREKIERSR